MTAGCARCGVALGAVAPTPIRAIAAEQLLEGARLDEHAIAGAAEAAAAVDARPIDDVRASAWYRRELLRNMIQEDADRCRSRMTSSSH